MRDPIPEAELVDRIVEVVAKSDGAQISRSASTLTAASLAFRLVVLAIAISATEVQAQVPAAVADDRAISVGRWDVLSVESNGKPIDPELVAMLQVEYQADGSWAVLFKRLAVAEGRSTNRQDRSPKTFEMETLGSESMQPIRYTGIYKHDGDIRVLCFVPDGRPRPEEFVAPRRSGRVLVTLKRAADR